MLLSVEATMEKTGMGGNYNGIPEDRKTHANVGVLSRSMYGTNGKYKIRDAQNRSHPL